MTEILKGPKSSQAGLEKSSSLEEQQTQTSIEYSRNLIKINDFLEKIEASDEVETKYRKILGNQSKYNLGDLLAKPQNEILQFLTQTQIDELEKKGLGNLTDDEFAKYSELSDQLITAKNSQLEDEKTETKQNNSLIATEDEKQSEQEKVHKKQEKLIATENEKQEKLTKVSERLDSIEGSLDSLKNSNNANVNKIFSLIGESKNFDKGKETKAEDIVKMEEKLAEVLKTLKNLGTLKSITDELDGADINNPKYIEFRKALIGIDPSFQKYFDSLENIKSGTAFSLDEVAKGIETESEGIVDIDLKGSNAVSKLSLIGSRYSLDKEIDKTEIDRIMAESKQELNNLKNSFASYQEFDNSFAELRGGLNQIWGNPNFKENLKTLSQKFSREIFDDLKNTYKNLGIPSDKQLKESDISNISDINDDWDLEPKIKSIFEKMDYLQTEIRDKEVSLVQKYKIELKEVLQRTSENKEKQLKTLEFFRTSGFDILPKWISNKIIEEVQGNVLTIPGLDLAKENIDLKNGNFGESGAFSSKENGLNIESKANLVKLINKIISGDVNKPLGVEAIASGVTVADPRFVRSELMSATRQGRTAWHYNKVLENLKKENR